MVLTNDKNQQTWENLRRTKDLQVQHTHSSNSRLQFLRKVQNGKIFQWIIKYLSEAVVSPMGDAFEFAHKPKDFELQNGEIL